MSKPEKEKFKRYSVGTDDGKVEAMKIIHTAEYARSEHKPKLTTVEMVDPMQGGHFNHMEDDQCFSMMKMTGTSNGDYTYRYPNLPPSLAFHPQQGRSAAGIDALTAIPLRR